MIGLRVDGKDLDTIAREFAWHAEETIDADVELDAASIMQSIFGNRDVLLIFDNAEDASLRRLIPGGRSSVIFTTRDRGLPVVLQVPETARVDVPALAEDSGVELLRKRLGDRVDVEADAAKRVVKLVGGLPLALQIVASLLQIEDWRRLGDMADALSIERERLAALKVRGDPHLDVRVSFNTSLKFLKAEEIDFFACLSVCDASSFAVSSAGATGGCLETLALERLGYLHRLSLVNQPEGATGTRFVLHPLLRSFAAELAGERGLIEQARERHARYFVDLVQATDRRDAAALVAIGEDIGETLTAASWLLRNKVADYGYLIALGPLLMRFGRWLEAANLMAQFLLVAEERSDSEAAIQIRIQHAKFLQLRGDLQRSVAVLEPVVRLLDDTSSVSIRTRAMFLNTYGGVLQRLGKFQEAADALERSHDLLEQQGDERGQAMVLNSLGGVLQRSGKFQEAADALERSYDLLEQQGDERGQAMVLNSLGGVLQRLGRFQEAADALTKSNEIEERLGNERGQAMVLNSLGGVLQRLGRFQEAADALTKSNEIEERLGNERGQAMVLNSLGGVLQRLGRFQEAADALTKSNEIEERLGNERGQAMVLNSLGGVLQRLGRFQEAADALERSKAISEQMGDERSLAMVLNSLGGVLQRLGKFQEAADALERSKAISEQMGDERSLAMVLNSLGGVLQRLGKFQEAADALERSKAISEQMGDERSLAMVLNSLGGVLQRLGKFQEAADALERSKAISEQMGDERSLAMVLNSLGGVLQRLGKFQDAADALERSHDLLTQLRRTRASDGSQQPGRRAPALGQIS